MHTVGIYRSMHSLVNMAQFSLKKQANVLI